MYITAAQQAAGKCQTLLTVVTCLMWAAHLSLTALSLYQQLVGSLPLLQDLISYQDVSEQFCYLDDLVCQKHRKLPNNRALLAKPCFETLASLHIGFRLF